jgi:DNA (cytosine-5)-methyltransferase 1
MNGQASQNKPPYRVPSMDEIAAVPWNGYTAISTFSGCGGSSLGYKMVGFRVLWASEFVPAAQEVYRLNHPDTILDTRDIRQVQSSEILSVIGMQRGELDLLDGSPPCASFSTAGKREAGWGKVKQYSDVRQRVDDLFFEYARLLEGLQPRVFVAENVSGLVKGSAKGYFKLILQTLKDCGYNVKAQVLDAQWLGVPQMRQRLIFVGVRNDLDIAPVFPMPLPYRYTVRECLPHIRRIRLGGHPENWKASDRPAATVTQSDGARENLTAYLSSYMIEDSKKNIRKYNIPELRCICAFPDDFQLTGTFAQQWERLARAVPPVMMSHIAATIRDEILCKIS